MRTIFTFFLFLVFKFLYYLFLVFHSCKSNFYFLIVSTFYVYIFQQHFPALAFYLPLLPLSTFLFSVSFLLLVFLIFYHDSLFTLFLGWFCTYCFWPLPWFSYFTFSISWLFVSGLLPWFSLHFFFGEDFVLTVFYLYPDFLTLLFQFFVLVLFSLFLSFSMVFFTFTF